MNNLLDIRFFEFFIELSSNNNKTWFDQNRNRYEEHVKKPFENLVQKIIDKLGDTDAEYAGLSAGNCVFRINKDVRFSKDKSPYKLNRSAVIAPGGKKDMSGKGFYIEVGPESCGFYAGCYMPEKEMLTKIREQIANEPQKGNKITHSKDFIQYFGEVKGNRQSKGDTRFKTLSAFIPEIKNTQFYIHHNMEPELFLETDIVSQILQLWKAAKPLSDFVSGRK